MKIPTLEEVKEHFKDAKVVKSTFQDTPEEKYRGELELSTIHIMGSNYWCDTKEGVYNLQIWTKEKGYAEIIEYKNQGRNAPHPFNTNKPMKKVIRLDEPKEEKQPKPIELTHRIGEDEWEEFESMSSNVDKIIYLGKDLDNGDMFAIYGNNYIDIAKGYLNDGVY